MIYFAIFVVRVAASYSFAEWKGEQNWLVVFSSVGGLFGGCWTRLLVVKWAKMTKTFKKWLQNQRLICRHCRMCGILWLGLFFFWNGTIIISRYIISRPQVFTEGLLLEIFITSHLIFYFINKEVFFSFLQAIVLVRFYSSYTGTKILWN